MSDELSLAAMAVLRTLLRRKGRPASGDDILERIFATTSEIPIDNERVCAAVTELETKGFAVTVRTAPPEGYDFSSVKLTPEGEALGRG